MSTLTFPENNTSGFSPIGITMGCPVGIGPEIIARFLAASADTPFFQAVVLGDRGVLERCVVQLGLTIPVVPWAPGRKPESGAINVLPLSDLGEQLCWGNPDKRTGRAMGHYVEEAVRMVRSGDLSAMVTCPISKSVLQAGGYDFPGHTEMLAFLCGETDYAMMLAGKKLRVTLVTIHTRLGDVPEAITTEAVSRLISITAGSLKKDFGIAAPCIAVAGLNPHAGEGGLFGDEEGRVIAPAVDIARKKGLDVSGPYPPDTVFYKASRGGFDAVVCMYHDQGLIPFKLLHFSDGVNVTLGLPIVRTSVDHGTAYDIAGKGLADPSSLAAAFAMAAEIVANRGKLEQG